jgi:hypothetical protein
MFAPIVSLPTSVHVPDVIEMSRKCGLVSDDPLSAAESVVSVVGSMVVDGATHAPVVRRHREVTETHGETAYESSSRSPVTCMVATCVV